uniref:tRNA pseudouridine synthase n=1 Tax=Alexandrium monilatum TaxID=311494 RepID=A0A7S4S0C1_9DINO
MSAEGKTYAYRLHVGPGPLDPLARLHRHRIKPAWSQALKGDLGRLREAAAHFVGRHDFSNFAREDTSRLNRTNCRTIHAIDIIDEGEGCCRVDVRLDGALWKMVRNVVGCIVASACGKFAPDLIPEMLSSPVERHGKAKLPFPCFPAEGLCLEKVHYPDGDF